jgi:hypothetical protein
LDEEELGWVDRVSFFEQIYWDSLCNNILSCNFCYKLKFFKLNFNAFEFDVTYGWI